MWSVAVKPAHHRVGQKTAVPRFDPGRRVVVRHPHDHAKAVQCQATATSKAVVSVACNAHAALGFFWVTLGAVACQFLGPSSSLGATMTSSACVTLATIALSF